MDLRHAIVGACVASIAVSVTQHVASNRYDLVLTVPIALFWLGAALLGGRAARGAPEVAVRWLLLAALITRLPLLGTPWSLSDDGWRYLWEGAVLAAGLDPFATAPIDVVGLDDALRARVNHPEISSIYPPFALLWFRALHELGGTPIVAQFAAMVADLIALLALRELTREQRWPAWVWALHPLPAIEAAGSAHLEAPALALCGLGLLALKRGRPELAWLGLGGGALVKVLPVLALPVLLWRTRTDRRSWLGLATLAALGAAAAAPVLGSGPALLRGFTAYATSWSFNGLAWPWLVPWLGAATRPALITGAAAWVAWITWRDRDPAGSLAAAGAAFVLTSPTAHPWYGLWALWPALVLGRWWWAPATGFLLCGYAVLSTWDATTSSWSEPVWLWWITWPPALACLALGNVRPVQLAGPSAPQLR